jgi:hypothetical protein
VWRSLVARGLWVAEVLGSNPGAPTYLRRRSIPTGELVCSMVKLDVCSMG